ncbi:MAG: hypothetical protein LBG84_07645, partial [Treponema sp.]|nr:hypothetical protein [Treponema sp.]
MDNPARVNPLGAVTEADKAAAQAALLAGYTTSKIIGPLSFQKNQVQELVLGGDLAGLTAVPDYFACYFNNLTAVDLSGLSGVTSFRDGFLAGC